MGMFSALGGLFGGNGGAPSMQPANYNSQAASVNSANANALGNGQIQQGLNSYGQGNQSLQDLFNSTGVSSGSNMALVENALSGQRLASDQVANDQLNKGLYGQGGLQQQAVNQATNLQNSGYTLKPEDYDAYGQAAGNISRQSGAQEGALAQALANRGLGGAQSGAANQAFSNQYGNKFEQLGQMQQQIADTRMQRNQQMLNDARNYAAQLSNQGENAENATRGQNLAGIGQQQNYLNASQNADTNAYKAQSDAQNQANQFNAAHAPQTLGDSLAGGLSQGVKAGVSVLAGGAPGAALGGLKSIFSSGGTPGSISGPATGT